MGSRTPPVAAAYPAGFPAAVVAGRSVSLTLFIPGRPEPLGRHRAKVIAPAGGKPYAQMYADPKSAAYEDFVALTVRKQALEVKVEGEGEDFKLPLEGFWVILNMRFNLDKPKSYPARVTMPTKKPDKDNLEKAVTDGLVKGLVLADDAMVTDGYVLKRYVEPGHPLGVEVDLTAIPTEIV